MTTIKVLAFLFIFPTGGPYNYDSYQNELDPKNLKIQELQEIIDMLVLDKNELLRKIETLSEQRTSSLYSSDNFDKELSFMKRRFNDREDTLLREINDLKAENDEMKISLKRKKITNPEDDNTEDNSSIALQLKALKKENESLKKLNGNYTTALESTLGVINNLKRTINKNKRKNDNDNDDDLDIKYINDHPHEFAGKIKQIGKDAIMEFKGLSEMNEEMKNDEKIKGLKCKGKGKGEELEEERNGVLDMRNKNIQKNFNEKGLDIKEKEREKELNARDKEKKEIERKQLEKEIERNKMEKEIEKRLIERQNEKNAKEKENERKNAKQKENERKPREKEMKKTKDNLKCTCEGKHLTDCYTYNPFADQYLSGKYKKCPACLQNKNNTSKSLYAVDRSIGQIKPKTEAVKIRDDGSWDSSRDISKGNEDSARDFKQQKKKVGNIKAEKANLRDSKKILGGFA